MIFTGMTISVSCKISGTTIFWLCLSSVILSMLISSFFTGLRVIYKYLFKSPNNSRQNDIHYIPAWPQYQENRTRMVEKIDALNSLPYEPVTVTSFDGLKLFGKYYHTTDGAPVDICFHGFRGTAMRDFCGASGICFSAGHNVLLIDERAHGQSEGKCLTYGVNEKFDCVSWVRYVTDRFGNDVKIFLLGVSMGASTVLLASGVGLPSNVKGIIADSPYTSPRDIMAKIANDHNLKEGPVTKISWLSAKLNGHFRLDQADVVKAVKETDFPVLLFHGEADSLIPCQMSKILRDANPSKVELVTVPESEHAFGFMIDEQLYTEKVREFFDKFS